MQKNKLRKTENDELNFASFIKRCLIFTPVFFIVGLICTTFIAFFFFNSSDPSSGAELCAVVSLYASFIICAILFIRGIKEKRIIFGFVYGCLILFVLYSLSLAFGNGFGTTADIITRILIPFVGALIGYISVRLTSKDKKRRKRRV